MADKSAVSVHRHEMSGPRLMKVYLRSKEILPLQGSKASIQASDYARQQGFMAGGIEPGGDHPYPIDMAGNVLVNLSDPVAGYEREVKVGQF